MPLYYVLPAECSGRMKPYLKSLKTEVTARLKKLFGDMNNDRDRLARSEMVLAAEKAKKAE